MQKKLAKEEPQRRPSQEQQPKPPASTEAAEPQQAENGKSTTVRIDEALASESSVDGDAKETKRHETESVPDGSKADNSHQRPHLDRDLSSFRTSYGTRKRIKTILGRDADDFKNAEEMRNNIRWQRVASKIDEVARVAVPIAFAIYIAVAFSGLDL